MENEYPRSGKISTRKCPTCGHHEVGYVTTDGTFYPLKAGDTIQLLKGNRQAEALESDRSRVSDMHVQDQAGVGERVAWIPAPLKHDRQFRMKYGVFVRGQLMQSGMTAAVYELAFRQKLQDLIEKEVYVPLPVILDRYFNTPHLAAGTPKDVADVLFEELDEVKAPVRKIQVWLDKADEDSLTNLIHPKRPDDLAQEPFREDDFKQELDALTLEDFFDLL
jgi:hypothetical protein